MASRQSITQVVQQEVGRSLTATQQRDLIRSMQIVTSTLPRNLRHDDEIAAEVDKWKAMIDKVGDPVHVANIYLDRSDCIPYHAQKVLQWLIASAYSHGLKKGKKS